MKTLLAQHNKEMREKVDKKFWYNREDLKLCYRDVEVRDENDELMGNRNDCPVVPNDIRVFIETNNQELIERVREMIEKRKLPQEHLDSIGAANHYHYAQGKNQALQDILDQLSTSK